MSRGFVKEDDQEEAPLIPPRPALPDGATNYVTQNGLQALKREKNLMEHEIANLVETDERERRRALALLNGKLNLLNERIQSARLLSTIENHHEVRFGAYVTYTINGTSQPVTIQIVGVDEADVKQRKISFVAPIAKTLTGLKVGDRTTLQLKQEQRQLEIIKIDYDKS
ncbi:MAG: GreA/GreB family elongation factor [Leeuwenhoekiella sp.]